MADRDCLIIETIPPSSPEPLYTVRPDQAGQGANNSLYVEQSITELNITSSPMGVR